MRKRRTRQLKHGDLRITIFPKNGVKTGRSTGKKRRKSQTGGFLNPYDFAYAGRDTVNKVGKMAPGIINKVTSDIKKIAQQRIDQAIKTGGAEVERIAPKIMQGAIEEVYKTPFRLFGNLGKQQFQKIKRKLFKQDYYLQQAIVYDL